MGQLLSICCEGNSGKAADYRDVVPTDKSYTIDDVKVLILTVEIKPEYIDEFVSVMTANAEGTRKEEGCLHYDFIREKGKANCFHTIEIFASESATEAHRDQPHMKAWGAFQYNKEKQPVVSKKLVKAKPLDLHPTARALSAGTGVAVLISEVVQDGLTFDEYRETVKTQAKASRDEVGCVRFDIFQVISEQNVPSTETTYLKYKVFKSADALTAHTQDIVEPQRSSYTQQIYLEADVVSYSVPL